MTKKCLKYFGEYGVPGGYVYEIGATRRGTVREIARLWKSLDDCGGSPDEPRVLAEIERLGGVLEKGRPE